MCQTQGQNNCMYLGRPPEPKKLQMRTRDKSKTNPTKKRLNMRIETNFIKSLRHIQI